VARSGRAVKTTPSLLACSIRLSERTSASKPTGRNEVQLTSDAPAKSGFRAKVTVISSGEPFRGRAANVL